MNIQTYYSILECIESPKKMVAKCKEMGYTQLILCDRNRLSGMVEFYQACKDTGISAIFGINLKVCTLESSNHDDYNVMYDIRLIAKTKKGFKNLLKIISIANDPEKVLRTEYQNIARFNLQDISEYTEDIICLLGGGSELQEGDFVLDKYRAYFKEVYTDKEIYWADVRYADKSRHEDWQVTQCILLKCILKELPEKAHLINSPYDRDNSLPSFEDYKNDPRFEKTQELLNSIEKFDILSKPKVPKFPCPDNLTQQEYLTQLAREGWKKKFPKWESQELKEQYAERVKYELSILQSCELDGYFLVVQDIINWVLSQNQLVGFGRGCLSSDTQIITKNGIKNISDICIGDLVITRKGEYDKVIHRFEYEVKEELVKISTELSNIHKDEITLTKDHKLLIAKHKENNYLEWIRAEDVEIGDCLFFPSSDSYYLDYQHSLYPIQNGFLNKITKITKVNNIDKVYDIHVENEHNYLTTNGIVHNSVGGSLVAYLLGIHHTDSIKHNLSFERFYSADRASGDAVSLPDIDTDFPRDFRKKVVEYIEQRYGKDRVAHISSFGTLQGSGVLTEVLRVHDVFDYKSIKAITKQIPAKHKLTNKMEDEKETSLIKFVLKHFPSVLESLGHIKDDKIEGEYAYYLEQAIRLEGIIRNTGIHASGILLSDEPIENVCPLAIENDEKRDRKVCSLEMKAAESVGLVKLDILGLNLLDKAMEIRNLLLGISNDQ